MSSIMTRARSARSQSIHITICHHSHGRTRRTSRCESCAPAVVKIEKKKTIKSYKTPTKSRNEVKTRRNTRAKSEDIVSHDKKKSTNVNQAKKSEIISIHENTKSTVNRPQPEPTLNRPQRTNIFKPRTTKDKIRIVATHKQFSNYNMNSLKEKFENIDKMSRLDRAATVRMNSDYVRSSFIDHAAVETHPNGTIAQFSNDFGSSGLIHMKPTAIGDTSTLDRVLTFNVIFGSITVIFPCEKCENGKAHFCKLGKRSEVLATLDNLVIQAGTLFRVENSSKDDPAIFFYNEQ